MGLRKQQSGMVDLMLAGAILIVLLVGGFIVWQIQDSGDDEGSTAETTTAKADESEDSDDEQLTRPADGVEAPTQHGKAILVGQGYDGEALRYETSDDGYLLEIIADLPELEDGKFYEGWIIGDRVVSTGVLENEEGETWSQVFTSDEDFFDYDTIIITIESTADGLDDVPEEHILEGSFS